MAKMTKRLLALLLAATMFMVSCGAPAETTGGDTTAPTGTGDDAGDEPAPTGEMTDVGTPRNETLIVDILAGNSADPTNANLYMPGVVADGGLHQLVYSHLWEVNTVTGEQFPSLAADMPVATDDTFTKFTFKMKEGLTWSDGEPLTAYDVEFTSDMLLNNPEIPWSGYYTTVIKDMVAVDELTIEMETVDPQPKITQRLAPVIWGHSFRIVPKHIWENEDPVTFKFEETISSGPYVRIDVDPNGNWYLYEKREDWENTAIGMDVGEPGPQYILFKYFGSEEKRTIAAINNEIDILQDISPESWDILREQNANAHTWTDSFPYANMDDPCQRGIAFNNSSEIYGNAEVRWALTLATDIKTVSMSTFGGMLRFGVLQIPPLTNLSDIYHEPMLDWLKEFSFDDGYQPFDENVPFDMVEELAAQGVEGLPTTDEDIVNTFGIGWWKYDTAKATEMLEANGFSLVDGQWMLPDGTPWTIVINAPADFEVQSMRLAFAVADTWNKFGINAEVKQMDSATFWNASNTGEYDAGSYWPSCGLITDTSENMNGWHSKFIIPTGEIAAGNQHRWENAEADRLLDELSLIPSDDPEIAPTITELLKVFVEEMPFIAMFGTSKFVPYIDTYFTGFQNSENNFEGPWWWWSQFGYYTPYIQPK